MTDEGEIKFKEDPYTNSTYIVPDYKYADFTYPYLKM